MTGHADPAWTTPPPYGWVSALRIMRRFAPVAQWIEQPPPKRQVARSIRVRGTIYINKLREHPTLPKTIML